MEQENTQNLDKESQINNKYVKNSIDLDLGDHLIGSSPANTSSLP